MPASLAPRSRWITMATVKVTLCSGVMRTSSSLRDGELGAKRITKHSRGLARQDPVPQLLSGLTGQAWEQQLGSTKIPDHQASLW